MARVPRDPPVEPRAYTSADEIDRQISKLRRRVEELEAIDIRADVQQDTGLLAVVESNIREAIREAFGNNSAEYREHQYLDVWAGSRGVNMSQAAVISGKERGKVQVIATLRGLISRLEEKREDLPTARAEPTLDPIEAAWSLLHPKVQVHAGNRFRSGHHADAVEAVFKELASEVRSLVLKRGGEELDGVALMQTAFSPKNPIIVLADLTTQSGRDMQRGYMDLFAGAMSAIRNPKAHGNVVIEPSRALHLLFIASALWQTLDARP